MTAPLSAPPSTLARLRSAAFDNAYLLLALTALFWGGNFVLGRAVAGEVPPIALAFLRWTCATALLLPFAWGRLRADWPVIRRNLWLLLALGAAGGGSFNTLSYIGLNYTTALNGLVLQSAAPVMIAIAAYVFFGDRLRPIQMIGIAISFIGVLVVITKGDMATLASLSLNIGDVIILFAFAIWAGYTVFLRLKPKIHWLSLVAVLSAVAALVNIPFFLWEALYHAPLRATTTTVLAVAYVSVFPSALAYIFFNRGVELIGANRAGAFLHLVPLFGALLAVGLLGEAPRLYHATAIALIIAGVVMAVKPTPSH